MERLEGTATQGWHHSEFQKHPHLSLWSPHSCLPTCLAAHKGSALLLFSIAMSLHGYLVPSTSVLSGELWPFLPHPQLCFLLLLDLPWRGRSQ